MPTRDEIEEIEISSRLYNEDGVEYMTVTAAARLDTDEPTKSPVMFIHNGGALVTVRYVELRPFTNVIERCARPGGCASADPENLMLTLIEAMVLVFLVILLFLQKLRYTLIPIIVAPILRAGLGMVEGILW